MKTKSFVSFVTVFLSAILLLTSAILISSLPVSAAEEGYELLENGSFEEPPGFTWVKYVACTVEPDSNGQEGACIRVTGRTHHTDIVRQYITKKLSFYGHGTYEIGASVRLADGDAQPVDLQIAIGMYSASGAKKWATSDFVTVTADGWAQITAQVNLAWEDSLEQAEFYLITREGQEGDSFCNLLIDNCSMKTLSYTGEEYATEVVTQAPTTPVETTPVEIPTEPITEAVTETGHTPETAGKDPAETRVEPEDHTRAPTATQPDGSRQSKVIGGMLISIGVILLGCGVALTVTYVKGGKQS